MKKFGIKGIWQHLPSTVIGFAIIAGGFYTAITASSTWADALIAVTAGAGLLGITFKGNSNV